MIRCDGRAMPLEAVECLIVTARWFDANRADIFTLQAVLSDDPVGGIRARDQALMTRPYDESALGYQVAHHHDVPFRPESLGDNRLRPPAFAPGSSTRDVGMTSKFTPPAATASRHTGP